MQPERPQHVVDIFLAGHVAFPLLFVSDPWRSVICADLLDIVGKRDAEILRVRGQPAHRPYNTGFDRLGDHCPGTRLVD